ncbi:MAG TPA: BolA family transcriptional regulator [Chromatiales bacterium]|nr:BolA family transcriptional regulator [Chromatiales bacterium]
MKTEDIEQRIRAGLPGCQVTVTGDGSHFEVTVVGEEFADLPSVKRQQRVYATVNDLITSGALHALTIKAYTPAEWATASKLRISS